MPGVPAGPIDRIVESGVIVRSVLWFWRRRLTGRGRFLLVAAMLVGLLGMDTRRALVFVLFSLLVPPLLLALPLFLSRAPRVRLSGRLPSRLTAGRTLAVPFHVSPEPGARPGPLSLAWAAPLPRHLTAECSAEFLDVTRKDRRNGFGLRLRGARRGRYVLPQFGLACTDALGLLRGRARWLPPTPILVYPRYYTIDAPPATVGRRYQPGGIPMAAAVGESLEFVGTREYREGDPPRKIHWRSSARLGRPVVKEYQEEYFSRVALVLDTFLPSRRGEAQRERFEAAISVLASLAAHFNRVEEVVDILAAGPDLYEVSTGRSLGALDNVLEVLACLEPCPAAPFETIAPHLLERLARLSTVVVVLLDWDDKREAFVRALGGLGVSIQLLLVHEGEPRLAWPPPAVPECRRVTPAEVQQRLQAEETR